MKKIILFAFSVLFISSFTLHIQANSITYIMFALDDATSQSDNITLFGDAKIENDTLILSDDLNQTSAMYVNEPIVMDPSDDIVGFTAHYSFEVTKISDLLGEGIVLSFTNDSPTLGTGGNNYGFGGVDNSIGIEIDFYSSANDFAAPHVNPSPIVDGQVAQNSSGLSLDLALLSYYRDADMNRTAFKLYVWIDYFKSDNHFYFYVSADYFKPEEYSILNIDSSHEHFNSPVYAGVTTSTTTNAMGLALNGMYVQNEYVEGGLDPISNNYVGDIQAPTVPNVDINENAGGLFVAPNGSTDNVSGIKTYEYSYDLITWTEAVSFSVTEETMFHVRAVDYAGNNSDYVSFESFFVTFDYRELGNPSTSLFYIGYDLELTRGIYNDTYILRDWTLEDGTSISNIQELDSTTTLYAVNERHLFDVTYTSDGSIPDNPLQYSTLETPITLLPSELSGYQFIGWYVDDTLFTSLNEQLSDDISLVALFEPLTLTMTIIDFSDSIIEYTLTTEGTFGSFTALQLPDGYEFLGLYTEPFGQGTRITQDTYIDNAETFKVYPYIRSVNQGETSSTGITLSILGTTISDQSSTLTWVPIILTFLITSLFLIIDVKRGKYHG